MKKTIVVVILIISLLIGILSLYRIKANALGDPLTLSMASAASYALFSEWGIATHFSAGTSGYSQGFMDNAIEDYINTQGGSLIDLFGNEAIRLAAGKLVVAQTLYDGIVNFGNWIINTYNIDNVLKLIGYDDKIAEPISESETYGIDYAYGTSGYAYTGYPSSGSDEYWFAKVTDIYGIEHVKQGNTVERYPIFVSTTINGVDKSTNPWQVYYTFTFSRTTGARYNLNINAPCATFTSDTSMNLTQDYIQPTVLNPGEHWEGQIEGWSGPDTNLADLMTDIFEDVADNNLSVEGEVVPAPVPIPTPVPIDPDIPLQDVPWEGLDTNLQNLYNQGLEEIGAIGDAKDAITDSVADQTGALEGAIADNAGVVSGAIDQAVSDIQDAISEQTQTLSESASATAEATETIAEALEDEAINWQKFDLRGLFPFCIPFDIYNMLEALDSSPSAPHVQLPFVIESIGFSYTIDLDFSAFDTVAAVMRQMELIVYGIALAWATSKVIKW